MRSKALLILTLISISSSVQAAPKSTPTKIDLTSCELLLSQIDVDLNDAIRAYVQLIEYYVKESGDADANLILEQILKAESVFNPFTGEKDSFSTQLSGAFDQIIKLIEPKDWSQIKEKIQKLKDGEKAEQADRADKSTQTEWTFNPQLIDNLSLNLSSSEDLARVQAEPAWHFADGRHFVALGALDKKVYLYELVDGRLKRAGEPQLTQDIVKSSPSWHKVGDRSFLAVGSDDGRLYLYELINGELKLSGEPFKTEGHIRSTAAWLDVNGHTYVSIGSWDKKVYLFELIDGRLSLVGNPHRVQGFIRAGPKWHVEKNGKIYLAVGSNDRSIYIYEFVNGVLNRPQDVDLNQGEISGSPTWHTTADGTYLAVITHGDKLNLLKLFHGSVVPTRGQPEARSGTSPAWLTYKNKNYIAASTKGDSVSLFKLENNSLSKTASMQTGGFVEHAPSWFVDERNDRVYLAASTSQGYLFIHELVDETLVERAKIRFGSGAAKMPAQGTAQLSFGAISFSGTTPVWQYVEGQGIFIALGSEDGNVALIRVMGPSK